LFAEGELAVAATALRRARAAVGASSSCYCWHYFPEVRSRCCCSEASSCCWCSIAAHVVWCKASRHVLVGMWAHVSLGEVTCAITCPQGHVASRSRDRAPSSAGKGEERAADALHTTTTPSIGVKKSQFPKAHAPVFRTGTTVLKVTTRARVRGEPPAGKGAAWQRNVVDGCDVPYKTRLVTAACSPTRICLVRRVGARAGARGQCCRGAGVPG
jgi:hypothetical protein